MAASATPLSALSPKSDRNTILARVTKIWEAINKRNGALLHTNLILLDEEENQILAVIRNNQKQMYLPLLKEDEVYSISNFKVVPGPKLYRSVNADYSINFYYRTKIEKITGTTIIPHYRFELVPFPEVNNLVGDVTMLIDVIGLVGSYGKLEKRNNGAQKMDIVLKDQSNESILVTLWEDRAMEFLELFPTPNDGPVFVVISGLLAKKFSGSASLSSTDATRCYVNIDYKPLNDLRSTLTRDIKGKDVSLPTPTIRQFVTANGDGIEELPISSILDTVIPQGTQVVRCICRGTIVDVLNGNGWYYNCCPTCARALGDLDGKYYCLACNEETPTLAQRFRIVVQVEDQTGTTTLTLFNKEAEQLVGVPLAKILGDQKQAQVDESVPPVIQNIVGKLCAFQIKITPYNIIQGCEEYTVTRVSEIKEEGKTAELDTGDKDAHTTAENQGKKKQKVA